MKQTHTIAQYETPNGVMRWAAVNAATGGTAFSAPDRERVEAYIAFHASPSYAPWNDPDWIPGSRTNWWARHSGKAA